MVLHWWGIHYLGMINATLVGPQKLWVRETSSLSEMCVFNHVIPMLSYCRHSSCLMTRASAVKDNVGWMWAVESVPERLIGSAVHRFDLVQKTSCSTFWKRPSMFISESSHYAAENMDLEKSQALGIQPWATFSQCSNPRAHIRLDGFQTLSPPTCIQFVIPLTGMLTRPWTPLLQARSYLSVCDVYT